MNKSKIILSSAAALVALVAVSGIALMTYASTNDTDTSSTNTPAPCGRPGDNLTAEQKAAMEARRTEMEANRTAIQTAIGQGYDAWVAAVKKYNGESAPILEDVTADNFSEYAEAQGYMDDAQELMQKARTIYDEIGVRHMGMGMGEGRGQGGPGRMGGFGGPGE